MTEELKKTLTIILSTSSKDGLRQVSDYWMNQYRVSFMVTSESFSYRCEWSAKMQMQNKLYPSFDACFHFDP